MSGCRILESQSPRVHVPNNWVLRVLVIVIIVQVWGKYMIIRYLDPYRECFRLFQQFPPVLPSLSLCGGIA